MLETEEHITLCLILSGLDVVCTVVCSDARAALTVQLATTAAGLHFMTLYLSLILGCHTTHGCVADKLEHLSSGAYPTTTARTRHSYMYVSIVLG